MGEVRERSGHEFASVVLGKHMKKKMQDTCFAYESKKDLNISLIDFPKSEIKAKKQYRIKMTNFGHIWETSKILIAVEYMSLKPGNTSGKEYECEYHCNLQQLNNEIGFNILRLNENECFM